MFANLDCYIDWSATGEMLQGIGSILSGAAIVLAAWFGSNTYNSWRRQKLAERKIDYAEKILTSSYKVRRELSFVRSPMMLAYELFAAESKLKDKGEWDNIAPCDRKKYTTLQAYYNRLDDALNSRKELEECYPIARAIFGEKLDKALQELNHTFQKVRVYADAQCKDTGTNEAFTSKIEMHLWEGDLLEGKNPVDESINSLILKIEDECIPILRNELKK